MTDDHELDPPAIGEQVSPGDPRLPHPTPERTRQLFANIQAATDARAIALILRALNQQPRWHNHYRPGHTAADLAQHTRLDYRNVERLLRVLEHAGRIHPASIGPRRWKLTPP